MTGSGWNSPLARPRQPENTGSGSLFQCRLVLSPKPAGLWHAVPGICAQHPRRSARGTGVPANDPWLDQIALPLVDSFLGGGRPGPDWPGWMAMSPATGAPCRCFTRVKATGLSPLLEEVAAPNTIKKVLKDLEPFHRLIYQDKGAAAWALFDRDDLPRREQMIRNTIKREGLWMR